MLSHEQVKIHRRRQWFHLKDNHHSSLYIDLLLPLFPAMEDTHTRHMDNGSFRRRSASKRSPRFYYPILTTGHRLPKRDWRDWFIMATMMGGMGYGLYFIAKVDILRVPRAVGIDDSDDFTYI